MYVKVFSRRKNNKIYYTAYLVKSVWDKKKNYSTQKIVKYFGSVTKEEGERLKLAYSNKIKTSQLIEAVSGENVITCGLKYDIGDSYLISKIWDEWGIDDLIGKLSSKRFDTQVSKILKILVLNRLLYPCSEHFIEKWYYDLAGGFKWLAPIDKGKLYYRRLYRYTKELNRIFPDLMKLLFKKLKRKIHKNVPLKYVYYDITSTYFEGEKICIIATYGYSRDKRSDKKQIVIALVTDEYGFPIYAEVLPGNTNDSTTICAITKKLQKEFKLTRCVLIGDRGMISDDNFADIIANKMNYLMALDKVHMKSALKDKLEELNEMEDGEIKIIHEKKKYMYVEFNLEKKKAEKQIRDAMIKKVIHRLKFLKGKYEKRHKKYDTYEMIMYWLGKLNAKYPCSRFYAHTYNEKNKTLKFRILRKEIKLEEQWDGFIALRSSIKDMISEKSLELYKGLSKVENAFKRFKHVLDIRPVYHTEEPAIKGHVHTNVLAYLIENYISFRLKSNLDIRTDIRTILKELANIAVVEKKLNGEIIDFEITECSDNNQKILDCFNLSIKKLEKEMGKTFFIS